MKMKRTVTQGKVTMPLTSVEDFKEALKGVSVVYELDSDKPDFQEIVIDDYGTLEFSSAEKKGGLKKPSCPI